MTKVNPRREWIKNFKKFSQNKNVLGEFFGDKLSDAIVAIRDEVSEETMKEFECLKTDQSRMVFIQKLECVHRVFNLQPSFPKKSLEQSTNFRQEGNKLFKKNLYRQALDKYNKSVMTAPLELGESSPVEGDVAASDVSQEEEKPLGLAFANRSAALLHLKEYDLCLQDIENAVEYGYPSQLQFKLFDRKGKCYQFMNKKDEALDSFRNAKNLLSTSSLNEKGVRLWISTLDKQINACSTIAETASPARKTHKPELPKLKSCHKVNSEVSNMLGVEYNEKSGRHIVATENIHVGEVLMAEKPYVSVLFPGLYSTHCYHCMSPVKAPFPCAKSSVLAFCNKECQKQASASYLEPEIRCLDLLDRSWCGTMGHLLYRIAAVSGQQALSEEHKHLLTQNMTDLMQKSTNIDDVNNTNKFRSICSLGTNVDKRTPDGLFDFSCIALFILKVLQTSGAFVLTEDTGDGFDSQMTAVAAMLLYLLQIVQCNACDITEIEDCRKFDEITSVAIGTGLYAQVALINHHCDPSGDLNFYGNAVFVRSIRNIPKGEEVNIAYCDQFFYNEPLRSRKAKLEFQYSFSCKCIACKESWPMWQRINQESPGMRCPDCGKELAIDNLVDKTHYRCPKCNVLHDIQASWDSLLITHDFFVRSMDDAIAGRYQDALPGLEDYLILMQKYLCPPWRFMTSCQAAIMQCYRLQANRRT